MPVAEFLDSQLSYLYRPFTMVDDADGIIAAMNRFMPRVELRPILAQALCPFRMEGTTLMWFNDDMFLARR